MDKISQRISSYPENDNYQVEVVQKDVKMDKKWEPKKTTILKSIEKMTNGIAEHEILRYWSRPKGKDSDYLLRDFVKKC